jgi:hypothetical protein
MHWSHFAAPSRTRSHRVLSSPSSISGTDVSKKCWALSSRFFMPIIDRNPLYSNMETIVATVPPLTGRSRVKLHMGRTPHSHMQQCVSFRALQDKGTLRVHSWGKTELELMQPSENLQVTQAFILATVTTHSWKSSVLLFRHTSSKNSKWP